jgi:hypothetical protein
MYFSKRRSLVSARADAASIRDEITRLIAATRRPIAFVSSALPIAAILKNPRRLTTIIHHLSIFSAKRNASLASSQTSQERFTADIISTLDVFVVIKKLEFWI